ncbi:hypothetical protein F971_03405 [Acinetobacter vivianii]|uniref:Uncharacterized protein n=1 Tax=Acinetobacter vivianii TaxID=1776742 RepID=N8W224_9GAMM|nr:hypothetical protein [Acinetobacter vivianii]ENU90938.1 hypothetical protein F971_03405 [Acinetobacter vivianii]
MKIGSFLTVEYGLHFILSGIEQHLTQGQEFPEEAEYDWDNGELDSKPAVWKLISRDDGGVVVLPNPF